MKILYPTTEELDIAAEILKEERGTNLPPEFSPSYASLVSSKAMELLEAKTTKAQDYDSIELSEENIIPTAKAFMEAYLTEHTNIACPETEAQKKANFEAFEEIFNSDGKITKEIFLEARNIFYDTNPDKTGLIAYDFEKTLQVYKTARKLADQKTSN